MILSELLSEYYRLKYLVENNSYVRNIHDYQHAVLEAVMDKPALSEADRGITQSLYDSLHSAQKNLDKQLYHLLEVYRTHIQSCWARYDEQGRKIYQEYQSLKLDNSKEILGYRINLSVEENDILTNRLKSYTDWKYPGALFRPGVETIVDQLVDLDPLYLLDHTEELMSHTRTKFNPNYQKRLRYYQVNDTDDDMFTAFPDHTFALAVFYYFFNFKTEDVIVKYLASIYNKMKPGGIVAFTLNDCDYTHNVALVEKMYTCFTPGSRLMESLYKIGYLPHYEYHGTGEFHWIELRMPGEINSVRGGQCIAKICQSY